MAEASYAQRFTFPGWYPQGPREHFLERLAIAEDLGLSVADGSEALAIAAREGRNELIKAIEASELTPDERKAREAAALPLDFPRGFADRVLKDLAELRLKCISVEPRTAANFPPPKPSQLVTKELAS